VNWEPKDRRENDKASPARGGLSEKVLCYGWINADALFGFSHALEFHDAVDHRKQRVVTANPDVAPRMHLRASLPNEYASGCHRLTAETLHTKPLCITVTAVAGTSTTFFMSHTIISGLCDFRNLNFSVILAVAAMDLVALPLLLFEHFNLLVFYVTEDFRFDRRT
jgi:hypothetical protein